MKEDITQMNPLQTKKRGRPQKNHQHQETKAPNLPTFGSDASSSDVAPKDLPKKKRVAPKDKKLANDLMGLYAAVGALVYSRNQVDGLIILQGAQSRAEELAELARHYPALYKALKAMTTGNAWMSLIVGHAGMAIAIMANHDLIPPSLAQIFMTIERMKGMQQEPPKDNLDGDISARANEHYAQYDASQSLA